MKVGAFGLFTRYAALITSGFNAGPKFIQKP
jgi:hypothetical protein